MHQVVPIKIIHFHNGAGGGVLSVIRNLLVFRQHPEIENHVIYTINRDLIGDYKIPGLDGAASEQVFYYSPKWNFYYTCRQLAKLLPDDKVIIVAHDWLELGMISNLGLQNKVIHFLHGDYNYYYDLAANHSNSIDEFIVVAENIKARLEIVIPLRKADIHYLRFPIPIASYKNKSFDSKLSIVFVGRCEKGKGYLILPQIEKCLKNNNINVKWHIAGKGSNDKLLQQIWPKESDITFYGEIPRNQLMIVLSHSDLILLPSTAEGMPLSIIEAMSAGVIPIVNNIDGGIQEVVINNITGYRVDGNKISRYVELISELDKNPDKLRRLSKSAHSLVSKWFEPPANTKKIELCILNSKIPPIKKSSQKIYGSRLDMPLIPNCLVRLVRNILT